MINILLEDFGGVLVVVLLVTWVKQSEIQFALAIEFDIIALTLVHNSYKDNLSQILLITVY